VTDGLREEMAQVMWAVSDDWPWDKASEEGREFHRRYADAVLALPAVRDLLAAAEAVQRVRAFVDGFAERGGGHTTATDELWIMAIRRALAGEDR
jgi:hypothetical protein